MLVLFIRTKSNYNYHAQKSTANVLSIIYNTFDIEKTSKNNIGEAYSVTRRYRSGAIRNSGVRNIRIRNKKNATARNIAHEIIHTLGRINHNNYGGLMTESVDSEGASDYLWEEDVRELLNPLINSEKGDNQSSFILYKIVNNTSKTYTNGEIRTKKRE